MNYEEARNWVDKTYKEIVDELYDRHIPFKPQAYGQAPSSQNDFKNAMTFYYIRNIKFPWVTDKADVAIGMLHYIDHQVVNGKVEKPYCSIETFDFPWDGDDVTVFSTPKEFADKVKALWEETQCLNDTKTTSK